MKIECITGFYKFYPTRASEITFFNSLWGIDLQKIDDFYTFEPLTKITDYSIAGNSKDGIIYKKTFSGRPPEILFQNGLTFDLSTLKVIPYQTITQTADIATDSIKMTSKYLLQCYSLISAGRIKSFSGFYNFNFNVFEYDRGQLL